LGGWNATPTVVRLAALQQPIAAVRRPADQQNAMLESLRAPWGSQESPGRTLLLVLLLAGEDPGQAPVDVFAYALLQVMEFFRVFRGNHQEIAARD
jgi:hypothetical protein